MSLPLALFLAAVARPCAADTVYMKNGRQLEGVVRKEDREQVVLDIGYGTVTLRRAEIERIRRSDAGERAAQALKRRDMEFEAGRGVPPRARELHALLGKTWAARETARDAKTRREGLQEEQQSLEYELQDMEGRYPELLERIKRADRSSPARYNRVIHEHNVASTSIQAKRLELRENQSARERLDKDMRRYLDAYRDLKKVLRRKEPESGAPEAEYLAWLRRRLDQVESDFSRDEVLSRRQGSHIVVDVVINGNVSAPLLLDTGASLTVISQEIAQRLGLGETSYLAPIDLTVADGRTVKGRLARLESVSVGGSRVEGVEAAVLPAPGYEGLLGMSFLRHFVVEVDAARGRIVLHRFK